MGYPQQYNQYSSKYRLFVFLPGTGMDLAKGLHTVRVMGENLGEIESQKKLRKIPTKRDKRTLWRKTRLLATKKRLAPAMGCGAELKRDSVPWGKRNRGDSLWK